MLGIFKTLVPIFVLSSVGCGDDDEGRTQAFLTIVGEDDLFGDPGNLTVLTVRYHDGQNRPLAGTVGFYFAGDAMGSTLSRSQVVTDSNGRALVELRYSEDGDAAFQVIAEAQAAAPARWRISVTPRALDVAGTFRIDSTFRLPQGLPPGEADALMTFVEMTNDPQDPATWVLDQVLGQLEDPFDSVVSVAPSGLALDQQLNAFLLENAPDSVTKIRELGDGLDQVIKTLNLVSQLDVGGNDIDQGSLVGRHRLTGAVFTVDGAIHEYTADQMALGAMTEVSLGVSRPSTRQLALSQHTLHVPYGRMLVHALDNVVVPSVDPTAGSTAVVLAKAFDCEALGGKIAEEVGFGASTVYENACVAGLDLAMGQLEQELLQIEADLTIMGTADLIDGNDDHRVEKLNGGQWEGNLQFSSGVVALPRPEQRFTGTRLYGPN
jgi:hypothetical protein